MAKRMDPRWQRGILAGAWLVLQVPGSSGELHVISAGGEAAPDGNGSFKWTGPYGTPSLGADGVVAFTASMAVSDNSIRGLFVGASTGVVQILRRSQPSPWLDPVTEQFDYFYVGGWNRSGQFAFGSDIVANGTRGAIFRQGTGPDSLVRLMRAGDPSPREGTMLFNTNRRPAINASGQVATGVSLAGTDGGSSDDFAVGSTPGDLQILARAWRERLSVSGGIARSTKAGTWFSGQRLTRMRRVERPRPCIAATP